MTLSYFDIQCTAVSVPPIFDIGCVEHLCLSSLSLMISQHVHGHEASRTSIILCDDIVVVFTSIFQKASKCQKWMKEYCIDAFDTMACTAALDFCESQLVRPVFESGLCPLSSIFFFTALTFTP